MSQAGLIPKLSLRSLDGPIQSSKIRLSLWLSPNSSRVGLGVRQVSSSFRIATSSFLEWLVHFRKLANQIPNSKAGHYRNRNSRSANCTCFQTQQYHRSAPTLQNHLAE